MPKNDIALVELVSPILERDFVPVCLTPQTSASFIGEIGTVVTYAPVTRVEVMSREQGELRGGKIRVVRRNKCTDGNGEVVVPKDGFCAGEGTTVYLCHGDSGGGIYAYLEGRWFLRGVLSTGLVDSSTRTCAQNDYVIFMDVMKYERFLGQNDFDGFDL